MGFIEEQVAQNKALNAIEQEKQRVQKEEIKNEMFNREGLAYELGAKDATQSILASLSGSIQNKGETQWMK